MKLPHAAALGFAVALAGAVVAAGAVRSTAAARTVRVTEREYALSLTPRSIAPGTVTFTVRNAGRVAHALAVKGTGLATVRTPPIQPGKTRSLTVTLESGTVTLWCPLGRHAAAGMKTTLRIGAAGGMVQPPPTTTNAPPVYDPGDGYR